MESKTKPIYVDTELYHTLDELATLDKITIAEVIRQLIERVRHETPKSQWGNYQLSDLIGLYASDKKNAALEHDKYLYRKGVR